MPHPPSSRQRRPRSYYKQTTSWPMWPFRLWQVYTCMVYMGAGVCKLNTHAWTSGNALSWCWYDETLGRFYPAFLIDLLYNRLISIKLQTWLSLLIENLSFITIWPMKTRKITFVAIVALHIGIELAMVMHIFEYLSVLGWVSFFVYPNDGKPNSEVSLIKNKSKKDGAKNVRTIFERIAPVFLMYLLIFDVYPSNEAEEVLPASLAYLVDKVLYPSFAESKMDMLTSLTGISTGPYILFKGKPAHDISRFTAVIRFKDGREPIFHNDGEWADSSFLRREIDYWYDTYTYYLMQDRPNKSRGEDPYYAALAVMLAERYGDRGISRWYDEVIVEPDNQVESVSIQVHTKTGSELPAPPGLGLFESIPREWRYKSACKFVFTTDRVQLEDQPFSFSLESMWAGALGYDVDPEVKNGCINYNPADEALHRKGQYRGGDGEPNVSYVPADDYSNGGEEEGGDDDDSATGTEAGYAEMGYRSPNNPYEQNDDEVNPGYGYDNAEYAGGVRAGMYRDVEEEEEEEELYVPPGMRQENDEEEEEEVEEPYMLPEDPRYGESDDEEEEGEVGERYVPPGMRQDDNEEEEEEVGERYVPPGMRQDDNEEEPRYGESGGEYIRGGLYRNIDEEEEEGDEETEAAYGQGQYIPPGNRGNDDQANPGYGEDGVEYAREVMEGLYRNTGEEEGSGDSSDEKTNPPMIPLIMDEGEDESEDGNENNSENDDQGRRRLLRTGW